MKFVVYRTFAVAYCIMFIVYFIFRALKSIKTSTSTVGPVVVGWRVFVLLVEFFSSINVLFVVFLKIRYPWTEFVGQEDGTTIKLENYEDTTVPAKTENDQEAEETKQLQAELDEELISSPESKLIGPAGDLEMDNKENFSEYGASERLDDDEEEEDEDPMRANETLGKVSMAAERVGAPKAKEQYLPYVVRALIPCYREGLDIVKPTIMAALHMHHDKDKLHVYLCDDGKKNEDDPPNEKELWVMEMRKKYPNLHYVFRPKAFKGHGKAGNLNYCLKEIIYKKVLSHNENLQTEDGKMKRKKFINRKEIVAIFDADMIAKASFLTRLLPYFAKNRRCVMVQSPQTFHNVPPDADFFDAHNINFFQYMLPAFSAWNITTCCGTNFLVAARALQTVNFFPTISVTEDMYLAMLLLAAGGKIDYHSENLVVGEAPQDLRQIFQQRSRWAKGTIEIFFKDNPLLKSGLPWIAKMSFFNASWSYFTSALFNPLFVLINAAGILVGLFPVTDLSFGTSIMFVCYYGIFYVIILATPVPHKHFVGLWVVGKMGHFFSFMSLKAIFNVSLAILGVKGTITFKVTNKKAKAGDKQKIEREDRDSSHRDIRFHWVMCGLIVLTIIIGIWEAASGTVLVDMVQDERNIYQRKGILVFMTFWMFQFFISYSLPLWYAYLPQDFSIQAACLKYLALMDSFLSLALVVLTALLFKVPFLIPLPKIADIYEFPPARESFWVDSDVRLSTVGGYIYDSALDRSIPSIVVYMRPGRDEKLMSQGGLDDWVSYRSALKSIADTIKVKNFQCAVIFEPDWMYESLYITTSLNDTHFYTYLSDDLASNFASAGSNPGSGDIMVAWNQEKWYRVINSFIEFAAEVPQSLTYLYLDAGNPYYHSSLQGVPMAVLNQTLSEAGVNFRGFSFNVANFYLDNDVMTFGQTIYNDYGWNFVFDSSRNGGDFSYRTWEEINACRFDPPYMQQGVDPQWYPGAQAQLTDSEEFVEGIDAKLWVKKLGEADGRMYAPGDAHECLINHQQECDDICPEVPYRDPIKGTFIWPRICKCDASDV